MRDRSNRTIQKCNWSAPSLGLFMLVVCHLHAVMALATFLKLVVGLRLGACQRLGEEALGFFCVMTSNCFASAERCVSHVLCYSH